MKDYKLELRNEAYPNLLTVDTINRLIGIVQKKHNRRIQFEINSIFDCRYLAYVSRILSSNKQYLEIFHMTICDSLKLEEIYKIFAEQLNLLVIEGQQCFDLFDLKIGFGKKFYYRIECSHTFYNICVYMSDKIDKDYFK